MNELMMNTNNIEMTEQHQLISALAEIFDGSSVRYFIKENNNIWFVCKDVVEAVGGTWHVPNFKKVVGEGGYSITPLNINGIMQNAIVAPHKSILKWLTLSRLPKADQFADLVWNIMDKVFKGEPINVQVDQKPKIEKKWTEALKLVNEGSKWGGRFIKLLEDCGLDRDKYDEVVNKFFSSAKGDYVFKKDVIHRMRANFQTYKRDALTTCKARDNSILNVVLLEVEREIESIWGRYEASSRGQTMRRIKTKEESK